MSREEFLLQLAIKIEQTLQRGVTWREIQTAFYRKHGGLHKLIGYIRDFPPEIRHLYMTNNGHVRSVALNERNPQL